MIPTLVYDLMCAFVMFLSIVNVAIFTWGFVNFKRAPKARLAFRLGHQLGHATANYRWFKERSKLNSERLAMSEAARIQDLRLRIEASGLEPDLSQVLDAHKTS